MATPSHQIASSGAPQPLAATVQPAETPLALRLPDEVWLLIPGDLKPSALLRAERVCKRFHRLIQAPSSVALKPGDDVELHPLLHSIDWAFIAADSVTLSADYDELNAFDYPHALNQFATSPACKRLEMSLFPPEDPRRDTVVIKDAQGVRCAKVTEHFATYWQGPAPADAAAAVRRYEGLPRNAKVTRGHARGQEIAFYGWQPPVAQDDGSVLVEGGGFWF
ncbi:hypothetical protein JCM9279_003791 [Rhodotorula babjevae]